MTCIGISNSSPSYNHVTVEGNRYEDRACCESGGVVPSDSCPATLSNSKLSMSEETDNTGLIVGITAAAVIFVLALLIFLWKKKSSQATTKTGMDKIGPGAEIFFLKSLVARGCGGGRG